MAKSLSKFKEIGKDMARVIKEDPVNAALDVAMTVVVGGYIFLSRMAGYYQGRVDFADDLKDEFKKLSVPIPNDSEKGGDAE